MQEPDDFSWLLTGDEARGEPIPRATASDELYTIRSNPDHIPSKIKGRFGTNTTEYHIGYQTRWGSVALCGVGNDAVPSNCRCMPWWNEPDRREVDCAECFTIARSLHDEGRYPDELG